MSPKVWLNGEILDSERAFISPADRGFLLGDGVFETLCSYAGTLFSLDRHLARLQAGAEVLGIDLSPLAELEEAVGDLLAAVDIADARIRVTVTSGAGPPGLQRTGGPPTVLVTVAQIRSWPPAASAVVAPWTIDEQSPLAGVKTISRAGSVLAAMKARVLGADEALFLNSRQELCEATSANVFVVREGRVETPPLSAGCLAGITREHVLRLCGSLGIERAEAELPRSALAEADEAFLTSSTREIQPLVRVDGADVAGGRPGPVTQRLGEAFRALVEADLARSSP